MLTWTGLQGSKEPECVCLTVWSSEWRSPHGLRVAHHRTDWAYGHFSRLQSLSLSLLCPRVGCKTLRIKRGWMDQRLDRAGVNERERRLSSRVIGPLCSVSVVCVCVCMYQLVGGSSSDFWGQWAVSRLTCHSTTGLLTMGDRDWRRTAFFSPFLSFNLKFSILCAS